MHKSNDENTVNFKTYPIHLTEIEEEELKSELNYFHTSKSPLPPDNSKIKEKEGQHTQTDIIFPSLASRSSFDTVSALYTEKWTRITSIKGYMPSFGEQTKYHLIQSVGDALSNSSDSVLDNKELETGQEKSMVASTENQTMCHLCNAQIEKTKINIANKFVDFDWKSVAPINISMEINIIGYEIKNLLFSHVKYIISVSQKGSTTISKVYRRFSEFAKLRDILINKYPGIYMPPLPDKQLFRTRDIQINEFRKKFLQIFMHELQYQFYFEDSPDILSFLDPNLADFPPNSLEYLNNRDVLTLEYPNALPYFQNLAQIARKNLWNSIHYLSDHKCLVEAKATSPINHEVIDTVLQSFTKKNLLSNLKKIKDFRIGLESHTSFISDAHLVIEHLAKEYKECNTAEIEFHEKLIEFQNEYIFKMNPEAKFITEDQFLSIGKKLRPKIEALTKEKPLYLLRKNLTDWIYREKNLITSCVESLRSIDPFVEKLLEIKEEIRKDKANTSRNKTYEHYEQKKKLYAFLKELITLNSIYLDQVRIVKYKNALFQSYYNALRFAIQKCSTYSQCMMSIIKLLQSLSQKMKHKLDSSECHEMINKK